MKSCIFLALILTLNLTQIISAQSEPSNPTLVFFIDHQNQPSKDYVQITLKIQAKDTSLITAINSAASTVEQITNMAKQFCMLNTKKKNQCKDIVDAGEFQIEPRYQLIRKEPVFMGFTVTHEVMIDVKSVEKIGHLVDQILSKSGITLQNFEWKAEAQPKTHEQAIAEGMQQGQGLCKQLGMKLGRIISIEEVKQQQQKPQQEQEQEEQAEQQQEQQQDNGASFRFEVECQKKQPKSK